MGACGGAMNNNAPRIEPAVPDAASTAASTTTTTGAVPKRQTRSVYVRDGCRELIAHEAPWAVLGERGGGVREQRVQRVLLLGAPGRQQY
mmetsp:Transcript_37887/g.93837  ORF Transcript_37887/g.93837 Transcript_37887/m.93837 type:complete len:90 (-) Transcript_37887:29-298(-)